MITLMMPAAVSPNFNWMFHFKAFWICAFCTVEYGGVANWVKDGFCDDFNNNEVCSYDGGDCCGLSVKKNFCLDCTCQCKLKLR